MKTIRASAFLACVLVLSGNLSYAAPAVTLYFEGNGQVELISSKGTRVLIDIMDPSSLSSPATKNDTLLTTHMHPDHVVGDVGQNALTPEQLEALGKVDVAIMQLDNTFSEMNMHNKKGFNMMAQVKPHLIIPTHISSHGKS